MTWCIIAIIFLVLSNIWFWYQSSVYEAYRDRAEKEEKRLLALVCVYRDALFSHLCKNDPDTISYIEMEEIADNLSKYHGNRLNMVVTILKKKLYKQNP